MIYKYNLVKPLFLVYIHDTNHTKPAILASGAATAIDRGKSVLEKKSFFQTWLQALPPPHTTTTTKAVELTWAWLPGWCFSPQRQRQLALLSYFINYVNIVLLSRAATEHHQVPPLNACKWACLQAWADLRLAWSPALTVIRSRVCQTVLNCSRTEPSSTQPQGQTLGMLAHTHTSFSGQDVDPCNILKN